jgi:uncharacterized membrane protein
MYGDIVGPRHTVMSITARESGHVQSAYVPVYDDLAALDEKSREAVMNYLCNPRVMTKRQRDMIHFLKSKDTAALYAKAKKLDVLVSIVAFLQKYKPVV